MKSKKQRLNELNWLPVIDEIDYTTHKMTFNIINNDKPDEMAAIMPVRERESRLKVDKKLDIKPKYLNMTKKLRLSFRNRAFRYNMLPGLLTRMNNKSKFKKALRKYMMTSHI